MLGDIYFAMSRIFCYLFCENTGCCYKNFKPAGSVSRVLSYAVRHEMIIYLGYRLPDTSSDQPGSSASRFICFPIWSCFEWGLPSQPVTRLLVRSYRTFAPLPENPAVSFCGTSLKVTLTGRYPASCSVKLGLSSKSTLRSSFRDHSTNPV